MADTQTRPNTPPASRPQQQLNEDAKKQASQDAKKAQEQKERDPTPVEEAQAQKQRDDLTERHKFGVDGSNIGLTTADDFTANLPRNKNGQVEYDSEGHIKGL